MSLVVVPTLAGAPAGTRFGADGQEFTRTTGGFFPTGAFAVSIWCRLDTAMPFATPWSLDVGTGLVTYIQTDNNASGNRNMTVWDNNVGIIRAGDTAPMELGAWYWFGLSKTGATAGGVRLLWSKGLGPVSVATGDGQAAFTPTNVRVGHSPFSGEWWPGALALHRVWTAPLTDAELLAEREAIEPVRWANLFEGHPLGEWRGWDLSAFGRHLTGTATALVLGPPVVEGRPRRLYVSAAGGTTPVSRARVTSYESLTHPAGPRVTAYESLGGLGVPRRSGLESLQPAALARTTAIESVARRGRPQAVAYEHLGGLTAATPTAWEALGRRAVSRPTAWEGIQPVRRSRATAYEAAHGVRRALTTVIESLGGVAQRIRTAWEAGGPSGFLGVLTDWWRRRRRRQRPNG